MNLLIVVFGKEWFDMFDIVNFKMLFFFLEYLLKFYIEGVFEFFYKL